MSIQSDSVNSASALHLQPVADVLPEQFAQRDFDYLGDTLVELIYEPEPTPASLPRSGCGREPQPYQVRIDLGPVEACDSLEQSKRGYAWVLSELIANRQEPPAMNLQEQARQA